SMPQAGAGRRVGAGLPALLPRRRPPLPAFGRLHRAQAPAATAQVDHHRGQRPERRGNLLRPAEIRRRARLHADLDHPLAALFPDGEHQAHAGDDLARLHRLFLQPAGRHQDRDHRQAGQPVQGGQRQPDQPDLRPAGRPPPPGRPAHPPHHQLRSPGLPLRRRARRLRTGFRAGRLPRPLHAPHRYGAVRHRLQPEHPAIRVRHPRPHTLGQPRPLPAVAQLRRRPERQRDIRAERGHAYPRADQSRPGHELLPQLVHHPRADRGGALQDRAAHRAAGFRRARRRTVRSHPGARMTLKAHIIIMTAFAVVSDAILIPFYPQFFQLRYGMDSSVHVGAYVAAISIAVMCTLPLWARVARRIEPLHLLVWPQLAAGTFSVLSNWAPDVAWYWALSLLMFMCKSSYLLMYPYLMRLTPKETHAGVVGILSVVVHFGAIFGAVVGGFVLQTWGPTGSIMAMAAGDFFQMAVCAHLIRSGKIVRVSGQADGAGAPAAPAPLRAAWRARLPILRLAVVMLVFDFGCFVIRPFFSVRWQSISDHASELASGMVFAIPGVLAIIALRVHARIRRRAGKLPDHTLGNLALGIAGLLMQAAPDPALVVVGRCIYGW